MRIILLLTALCFLTGNNAQSQNIYHNSWIDLNKNGKKDTYEDRTQPVNSRIDNLLSQMTLEEKSCQLATLYGYSFPFSRHAEAITLYPFGQGLSYTSFAYSNLQLKQDAKFPIIVSADITNTCTVRGDEVAQLYLTYKVSSVTTYEMQLRGFERLSLLPGETKTVRFELQRDDLALINKEMKWVVEAGGFEIKVGSSSTDIRLRKSFSIK